MFAIEKNLNWRTVLKEYGLLTVGLVVYSLGWTAFLIPMKISGGGASGIGTLVYFLTGIPVGYTFLAVNALLIGIAMKAVGVNFGFKTIYAVIVASLILAVEQMIITKPVMPNDLLLSAIIGGAMSGLGIAIAFTQGGSTGGTDIIAMIVTKYRNISPGKVILLADIFIVSAAFLVPQEGMDFIDKLGRIMYGYITMVCTSYVIDAYLAGQKQSVQIFIFSKNYEAIADRISNELRRGVSVLDAKGWYTKEEGHVLLVVVRRTEATKLYRIVKQEDSKAFISSANVMGVFGQGFESIRP